jgi:hypothetical protein
MLGFFTKLEFLGNEFFVAFIKDLDWGQVFRQEQ